MPRPARLNIHRHFDNLARGAEKVPRVACKYCSHSMKKDVSRMAKHLLSCAAYKSWAASNGGEEPDLTLLQNGRESLSHAAVVAAAATAAAGGALSSGSPHAGHAQATQSGGGGGGQDVFMHQSHQHQHQHQHPHHSPTGHGHLLGSSAGGAGSAGGVGRERSSEAALLASIQGSLRASDPATGASRDSRGDVTMQQQHDVRSGPAQQSLPPPPQPPSLPPLQQQQQHQQQQTAAAPPPLPPPPAPPSSIQSHGLSSNMFAQQPTTTHHLPSPSPGVAGGAAVGGGGGGRAAGGGGAAAGLLDPGTRKKLDVLYARAIISEGHQFNLYDQKNHPHMYEFLKALNQQYEPPDRNDIANLVMETFFSKEQW